MMKLCSLLASGAVVVAAGLLTAQERTNPNIQSGSSVVKPGQTSTQNSTESGSSAQGRTGTGTGSATSQRGQSRLGQSQRGQSHQGAGMSESVDQYVATCLINKNQGEIELSKLAQQRAESQEVKQFAAQMIKDHTDFVQKLRTAQGEQGTAGQSGQRSGQSGINQSGSSRSTREGSAGSGSSSNNDSSNSGSGSSSQRSGSNAGSRASGSNSATETERSSSSAQNSTSGSQGSANDSSDTRNQSSRIRLGQGIRTAAASDSIPVQTLVSIDNDVHERVQQAMRQELEQKQGREFDKAFMGAQCHMHLGMQASLEALQSHVSQDLQQTLRQGAETTKQHLTHAKQIKEQIEGKSGAQTTQQRDEKTSRRQGSQQSR